MDADPGAGERLFHEARLAYAAALDRTWGEIQRRSVGYRLIVPDGELANGGRAGYLAALREVWEEGGERLAQEYLRYLEAVQPAWLAMAGSDLDPAALGRIGASLAEAALWAAASLERRGGRER
jgi:8-oxo-dGTP pyrophosphatase MutT (NUDIX family)